LSTPGTSLNLVVSLMVSAVIFSGYTEKNVNPHVYPESAQNPIFSDIEKINNTAGYYLKVTEPLDAQKINILRENGVRELYNTSEDTIYYGLIEESSITMIENLDFVQEVYLPQIK